MEQSIKSVQRNEPLFCPHLSQLITPQELMDKAAREGRNTLLIGLLLFLLTFSVYNLTLCPTVYWYDSGELISACHTLGLAHPTGYPLYTILGRVVSLLPFGTPAVKMNVMSALFGALTVVVMYLVMKELISSQYRKKKQDSIQNRWTRLCENDVPAITASLIFAFSPLFWTQTAIAEVYTLHTFLIALLVSGLLLWTRTSNLHSMVPKNGNGSEGHIPLNDKYLYTFSFLLGLSLGHHLTTLLFVPAFLFFILATNIHTLKRIKLIVIAFVFLLLGLSVDLYLLIRADVHPIQNWGNPNTWSRLIDVVTGAEIRARPTRYEPHSIGELFTLLRKQFLLPGFVLGVIGIYSTLRRRIILFVFFLLFFAGMILYILRNYDFLEDQYLPVFLVFALWIGFGIRELISFISSILVRSRLESKLSISATVCVLLSILPFSLLALNYRSVDLSNQRIAYDYGKHILEHLDSESMILSEDSNIPLLLYYLQQVEGKRPDVTNVYLFLMNFDWYREQLSERSPEISVPILPDNAIPRFIERNVRSRSIYYSPFSKEPNVDIGRLIPRGFLFQIQPERTIPSKGDIREHFSMQDRLYDAVRSPLDQASKDIFAQIHGTMGLYFERIGMFDEAVREYTKALEIDSLNPGVHYDLGSFAMGRGKFKKAIGYFEKVLKHEPSNIHTRYLLSQCYARAGDVKRAVEEMERVVRNQADEPRFRLELGVLYGQVGEIDRAMEAFEVGLKLDPHNVDLLYNMGIAETKSDHFDAAIHYFERAEREDSTNVEVAYALASSYAERKEYEKAEGYFRKTLQLGGPNPSILEDLGYLYSESGQWQRAMEVWETALTMNPNNTRLRNELSLLREKVKTKGKLETEDRKPD